MSPKSSFDVTLEDLYSRSKLNPETGCLEWQGAHTPFGHAQVRFRGKLYLVSHVVWMLVHNVILEKGSCVLHTCDNPPCIEPSHLFLGDRKVNAEDRAAKGRSANSKGENNPNSRLTESDVRDIRDRSDAGESLTSLADEYHISVVMVSNIHHRKNWKEL